eukprot:GHVH01005451.1.p1 GENE.GHVH01005451.1~~GHVH01005451.1.p1  ORF type:complete len:1326 (+),score=222.54 GHVH01005451.1:119-4096(+)
MRSKQDAAGAPSKTRPEAGRYVPERSSLRNDDKECNVKVIVRCRPLTDKEKYDKNMYTAVKIQPSSRSVVVSRKEQNIPDKRYYFDGVCNEFTTQKEVFEHHVVSTLDDVLEGFNCTLFAYGQTGTGKTFTMEGDLGALISENNESGDEMLQLPVNAGIIPRCVQTIFDRLQQGMFEYSVKVSYLEIYNEELCDLLAIDGDETKQLRLFDKANTKSDPSGNNRGLAVSGLREVPVSSMQDIFTILGAAVLKRRVAETDLNKSSSRSHCIFTIVIHMRGSNSDDTLMKVGKLNLVDLAGSENIQRSGAMAHNARTKEAGIINQSLLTLGRVINALVEHNNYVPYRDSKLTRLLMESLGGRTKTCIIATVSPSSVCNDETQSTLDYAHRAKNIKNRPEVNQKAYQGVIMKDMGAEIDRLKVQLGAQRDKDGGIFLKIDEYEMLKSSNERLTDLNASLTGELAERRTKEDLMRSELSLTKRDLTASRSSAATIEKALSKREEALSEASLIFQSTIIHSIAQEGEVDTLRASLEEANDMASRMELSFKIVHKLQVYIKSINDEFLLDQTGDIASLDEDVQSLELKKDELIRSCGDLYNQYKEITKMIDKTEAGYVQDEASVMKTCNTLKCSIIAHSESVIRWKDELVGPLDGGPSLIISLRKHIESTLKIDLVSNISKQCLGLIERVFTIMNNIPISEDEIIELCNNCELNRLKLSKAWIDEVIENQVQPVKRRIQKIRSELKTLRESHAESEMLNRDDQACMSSMVMDFQVSFQKLMLDKAERHESRMLSIESKMRHLEQELADVESGDNLFGKENLSNVWHSCLRDETAANFDLCSASISQVLANRTSLLKAATAEVCGEVKQRTRDMINEIDRSATNAQGQVANFSEIFSDGMKDRVLSSLSDVSELNEATATVINESFEMRAKKRRLLEVHRRRLDESHELTFTSSNNLLDSIQTKLQSTKITISKANNNIIEFKVIVSYYHGSLSVVCSCVQRTASLSDKVCQYKEMFTGASLEFTAALMTSEEVPLCLLIAFDQPTAHQQLDPEPLYPKLISLIHFLRNRGAMLPPYRPSIKELWFGLRRQCGFEQSVQEAPKPLGGRRSSLLRGRSPSSLDIDTEDIRRHSTTPMVRGENRIKSPRTLLTATVRTSRTSTPDSKHDGDSTLVTGEVSVTLRALLSLLVRSDHSFDQDGEDVEMGNEGTRGTLRTLLSFLSADTADQPNPNLQLDEIRSRIDRNSSDAFNPDQEMTKYFENSENVEVRNWWIQNRDVKTPLVIAASSENETPVSTTSRGRKRAMPEVWSESEDHSCQSGGSSQWNQEISNPPT